MSKPKDEEKKEFTPMTGQFPDASKITCKDCQFRDKTVVKICGKAIPAGITKSACEMYKIKPEDVLWNNGPCQFKKQEA